MLTKRMLTFAALAGSLLLQGQQCSTITIPCGACGIYFYYCGAGNGVNVNLDWYDYNSVSCFDTYNSCGISGTNCTQARMRIEGSCNGTMVVRNPLNCCVNSYY